MKSIILSFFVLTACLFTGITVKGDVGIVSDKDATLIKMTPVKTKNGLAKRSKTFVYETSSGDKLQLAFDLYYDPVTYKLVEAYFIGGYGVTRKSERIDIIKDTQEGGVDDVTNTAQFSIFVRYLVYPIPPPGSVFPVFPILKDAFVEATIAL